MSALAIPFILTRYTRQRVEPLELTVRFARPLGRPCHMVCAIGDTGEPEIMFQGEYHQTTEQARASAWDFAARAMTTGMGINYRSDLES